MSKELIKTLVDISPFDTARNVYYLVTLSKELKQEPEKLADKIRTVSLPNPSEKRFAKALFEALIDCSNMQEQINLLSHFFSYKDKTPYEALALSLNDLDNDGLH